MSESSARINYIGIDYGEKRVGVAIAPLGLQAVPLGAFNTRSGVAEREIIKVIEERCITHVVVGMPLNEKGERTEQCDKVERFCRRLGKRVKVEFIYYDEHLTSVEADSQLEARGLSAGKVSAKKLTDQYAATIILQDYLNSSNRAESLK